MTAPAKRKRLDVGLYSQFETGSIIGRPQNESTIQLETGGDSTFPIGKAQVVLSKDLSGAHSLGYNGLFWQNDIFTLHPQNVHALLLIIAKDMSTYDPLAQTVSVQTSLVPLCLPPSTFSIKSLKDKQQELKYLQDQLAYCLNLFFARPLGTPYSAWTPGTDIASSSPQSLFGPTPFVPVFTTTLADQLLRWSIHPSGQLVLSAISPIPENNNYDISFNIIPFDPQCKISERSFLQGKSNIGWFNQGAYVFGHGEYTGLNNTNKYRPIGTSSYTFDDLRTVVLNLNGVQPFALIDHFSSLFSLRKHIFPSRLALITPRRYMVINSDLSDNQSYINLSTNTNIDITKTIALITDDFETKNRFQDTTTGGDTTNLFTHIIQFNPTFAISNYYIDVVDEFGIIMQAPDDYLLQLNAITIFPAALASFLPLNPDPTNNPDGNPLIPYSHIAQYSDAWINENDITAYPNYEYTPFYTNAAYMIHFLQVFPYI
jgi:hypothetical protein